VPDFLTDLADLGVGADGLLAAVLAAAAQPVWVVDGAGVIRLANPAAVAALGYDGPGELVGRDSREMLHGGQPDQTPHPADWLVRRDGSRFPVSSVSVPVAMAEGPGAVVAFTDIEDRVRAEHALGERDAVLGEREDSLRRIAALVAGGATSADVFAAIAREVGQVVGLPQVVVLRFDPGQSSATVIGGFSEFRQPFEAGTRWPLDGPTLLAQVQRTARPARIDDYTGLSGPISAAARQSGFRASASAPIIVDGDVWGAMTATTRDAPLPDQIEDRLAEFTELVATAIANTARRDQLARLADEQAALRRVATLVACGTSPEELFAAVVEEVARVFPVEFVAMGRYESDATMTTLATSGDVSDRFIVGGRRTLGGNNVSTLVAQTGRSARVDDDAPVTGAVRAAARERRLRAAIGTPIVVEGRLWGVITASSRPEQSLPADTEAGLASFTELVATAIANAEARTELAASRARIVAAADEERRQVVRDLHDGAQQRLVHTVITLKLARRALLHHQERAPALVGEALEQAEQATAELRELAHGILPAVLTQGGLRAGVDALALRMAMPVDNGVSVGRLPASVEATAYFVIAEALTNVSKHAHAGRASVAARVQDATLRVRVRDDGVGGALPGGSGLLGLADRLTVLDGSLRVESPIEGGTLVAADIPLAPARRPPRRPHPRATRARSGA
jgi:signal transduction histidine kinase